MELCHGGKSHFSSKHTHICIHMIGAEKHHFTMKRFTVRATAQKTIHKVKYDVAWN